MPKLSPTMEEGMIVKWLKVEGEHVAAGDVLLEIATDKATLEHQALDEGWLRKILVKENMQALVNQPIAIFTESADENIESYEVPTEIKPLESQPLNQENPKDKEKLEPVSNLAKETVHVPLAKEPSDLRKRIVASPLAKKLAKANNLDLRSVKGSGPGGRIIKKDLEQATPLQALSRIQERQGSGTFDVITLTPMRKVIAKRLQESKSFIPHFYLQNTVDALPLISLREQLKKFGVHVTFNDLMIKAVALALKEHPEVNSGFNTQNNTIMRFKTVDISVAVSTASGLVTPIVAYADTKSVQEISVEIKNLALRAKENKLLPEEYLGGSFTISNLGMYGTESFQAIINPPQAAILALGAILEQPVVKEGSICVGKTFSLTLSVDHRVVDGVLAANFMKMLGKLLESPAILLL